MPNYPYTFQLPPLNVQDIPNDGVAGEFLGINGSGVLDWLTAGGGGTGDMLKADNLSGLASYPTARTNLGLGTGDSPTFANLTLTSPSLSSSAPVTISQTWNNAAVAFTGLKFNAAGTSGTNSAAGSSLLDLQVGGVSKFNVDKASVATLGVSAGTDNSALYFGGANYSISFTRGAASLDFGVGGDNRISFAAFPQIVMAGRGSFAWSDGSVTNTGTVDTIILRDAANTLALRNGAVQQMFRVYGTYSDASNYRRLAIGSFNATEFDIQTEGAGGGVTAGPLNFGTAGVRRMTITTAGNVGIGTTAPSEKLHVVGNAQFDAEYPYINLKSSAGGNYYIQANSTAAGYGGGNYLAYFIPAGKGHTWIESTNTRMIIAPTTGNVGIGTTSPTSKLQVTGGDVEIETVTSGIIMKAAGTATRYRITLNAGGTDLVFTAI